MKNKNISNILILLFLISVIIWQSFVLSKLRSENSDLSLRYNEIFLNYKIKNLRLDQVFYDSLIKFDKFEDPFIVVVISDFSCNSCFSQTLADLLSSIRSNKFEIKPTQILGIYYGSSVQKAKEIFHSVFNDKYKFYVFNQALNYLNKKSDYILLISKKYNSILFCSELTTAKVMKPNIRELRELIELSQ